VQARVVEDSGEVNNRRESADHSRVAQVLVADDGLADGFSLRHFGVVSLEQVEGDVAAGKFEREVCGRVVRRRGADIVEQGCEEESF